MRGRLLDGVARIARDLLPARKRADVPRPSGGPDELRLHLELRARRAGSPEVDVSTAEDLDLEALFSRVDRCASAVGQQWLWARLRTPPADHGALDGFDALVTALAGAGEAREGIRRALARLGGPGAYLLPYVLEGELPERPAAYRLVPCLTGAALLAIGATILLGVPGLLALVAICAVNVVVRLSFRKTVAPALGSLPAVRALLKTGIELARPGTALPDGPRGRLEAAIAPVRSLLRTTAWLALEADARDELTQLFYEYVNLLFLLDVNALLFSLGLLSRGREALRDLFEVVGEVDGALATAAFRESLPAWCRPRLLAGGEGLRVEEAFHPLLETPVPVSIAEEGASLLVTGSNMSGKTTFLKTLGVGTLLGRTLATCPARRWEAPPFVVVSAMSRAESLAEGTSYYLGQVRRVGGMIAASDDAAPRLFLLDELFRGTNTIERIAAARAVLARLARPPHRVAVATHDLELVPLLRGAYVPFHFREELRDGALSFDHRLRPGPSSTRSALALLRWCAYPTDVVELAEETVGTLLGSVGRAPAAGDGGGTGGRPRG